jgi:hypothetical protein
MGPIMENYEFGDVFIKTEQKMTVTRILTKLNLRDVIYNTFNRAAVNLSVDLTGTNKKLYWNDRQQKSS